MSWYVLQLPCEFYCIEFIWFQYRACTTYQSPRGVWQTNNLLMKWGSHEFLTAFVLFIKPDQTMKIQTSLKGKREGVAGNKLFLRCRQQRFIDGEGKQKKKKGGEERKQRKTGRRRVGSDVQTARVHIWINASTKKGNFLRADSSSPPQVARRGICLPYRELETRKRKAGELHVSSQTRRSLLKGPLSWLQGGCSDLRLQPQ